MNPMLDTGRRLGVLVALTAVWAALLYVATGGGPLADWLEGWARWDAHWYRRIATEGYGQEPASLAFPPGYPWLVQSLAWLFSAPFFLVGSLTSLVSLLLAGLALGAWAKRDFDVPGPLVYAFWLCGPAAYFALAPYSDLLFCALLFPALYWLSAERLERHEQVLLWLALALLPFVRITAFALFALLLLRRWAVLAMLPGVAVFVWLNAQVAGHPLHFLAVQSQFLMPDGHLLDGLRGAWNGLGRIPPVEKQADFLYWLQFHAVPLGGGLLILATLGWLAWRRAWVAVLALGAIFLMSHNQGFWRSVVRYDLVLWPFVALPPLVALRARLHRWDGQGWPLGALALAIGLGALMMLGLLLQLRFAGVFHRGGWGF